MTSRQAHRAYLNSKRVPRLSKAEERRMEREEQERIRSELRQQQAQARAAAARERKRAKEEEAKREKRRRGEPTCPVTASQGMISGFLRKTCSVPKAPGTAGPDENVRNAGGARPEASVGDDNARNVGMETPKEPSRGVGYERNSGSPVVEIAKHSPRASVAGSSSKPPSPKASGKRIREDEKHAGNQSSSALKQPDITHKSEESRDSKPEGDAGLSREAQEDRIDLDRPVLSASTKLNATVRDGNKSNAKPGGDINAGEAGQDLDDLFLSASQLVREVEGMPPPTRKRSRDEAFLPPEPPPKHTYRTEGSPKPGAVDEMYDLGISSQELLQLEVAAGPPPERPPAQPPPSPPDVEKVGPEPPAPDVSFSDSFSFCSQELRDIDALIAEVPHNTKQPPTPTNKKPTPRPNVRPPEGRPSDADTNEPPPPTTHANMITNHTTNERDTMGAVREDPEPEPEPDEPQRFFTSGTQELISLAEKRSRATAEAEARRRRSAARAPSKPRDAQRPGGAGNGGEKPKGGMPGQAGRAGRPVEEVKTRKPAGAGHAPHERNNERKLGRSSSLNLDDDEWWEDLDNTDLEALLAVA